MSSLRLSYYIFEGAALKTQPMEDVNRYRSKGVRYVEFDKNLYGAGEGGFQKISGLLTGTGKVVVDLADKHIILRKSGEPLHDPEIVSLLKMINEFIPEFGDYNVSKFLVNSSNGYSKLMSLGVSINDLLKGVKVKSGEYGRYKRGDDTKFGQYKFEVLKDIQDLEWYHATKRSNLDGIKKRGLVPSKEFDKEELQKHGWTDVNFDLQNVVYLTNSYDRVLSIGKELTKKFGEDALILKISGAALNNEAKLVVDEDWLRDYYTGAIVWSDDSVAGEYPEYVGSLTDSVISGIGYKGVIPFSFIETVEVIQYEDEL
jgi:hypothetical protein